jgi:hypothetical protein
MSCDITAGRVEACKSNVGGLRNMYIGNFSATMYDALTIVTDEITALATPVDVFKFELRGDNNTFEESNENSRDNGTSFWTQTASIAIKKQDKLTQGQLKLLSYGRPHVILEDYNGNFRLLGAQNGCEVSVSTATGGAMGDMNGYTLAIEGKELSMAYFVDPAIVVAGALTGFDVQTAQLSDGVLVP